MCHSTDGWFQRQCRFLRRQFLQEGSLPFTDILSEDGISEALTAIEVPWNDRIYPPLVTLWVFLAQILSADHSCRAAVARLIAHRISWGKSPCSSETGAYCQARKRLPEKFFSAVARLVGRKMDSKVDPKWLWKGRHIYMFDGSTVSMPDTPANQAAYPQPCSQKAGVGFPIARIAAIISLSCGAVLVSKEDLAGLFRSRWHNELDLRTIKITMQMDILRCKSPELVRKEIWTHILAYNLIRTIIAQAASKHDLLPRSISFKGTLQTLEAFQPLIAYQGKRDLSFRTSIYQNLLDAIAVHRVANRPDRFEPPARKRRYKNYPFLMKSRQAAKSDILKGLM